MKEFVAPPGAFRAVRPLVLASSSPRRRDLLATLGLAFSVRVVEGSEPAPRLEDEPAAYAMRAARAKAEATADAVFSETPDAVVIGADTIVVLHEENGPVILGKPESRAQALAMLLHLRGRTHTVYTGCCLIWLSPNEEPRVDLFHDAAKVTFAQWPEDVLRAYVATGECDDKAGSYAMQGLGTFLVERITGQWSTIVGLPVEPVARRLMEGGGVEIQVKCSY